MAKSKESFEKKEREKKRLKKQQEKRQKKEAKKLEREANKDSSPDSMMAYVDGDGNIVDSPPDPSEKKEVPLESIELGVPKREKEVYNPIRNGKVDYFDDSKGYGFIKDLEDQESYFVHVKGCIDEIMEGDKVQFELERGMKGMNAVRVKKI